MHRLAAVLSLMLAAAPLQAADPPPAPAAWPDFTAIVERNAPAVVHVEAHFGGQPAAGTASAQARRQWEILQQLFGLQGVPVPPDPPQTALGSGFIIDADGYILTNNHVVKGADAVHVQLQDHRRLAAQVVGTDPSYDIALLKVEAGRPLPTVTIGDSRQLKAGQWVLAIGSPFGFDYTVTHGIVSAVGRHLGGGQSPWLSFIQTDVPINRGNSGGPLFNLQGQVVGINSQIYSQTGGYQGVAFSIPIDLAMQAAGQLKRQGFVARGMLGVLVQSVDAQTARRLGLPGPGGALVRSVAVGSGADRAGLRVGDVIRAYDGEVLYEGSDLPPRVAATPVGREVRLTLWRKGQVLQPSVRIGAADPGTALMSVATDRLGLQLEPQGGADGVRVRRVGPGPAERQGLQAGDRILQINQLPVRSVHAFEAAVDALKPGETVLLLIRRAAQTRFVAITLPAG